MGMNQWAFTIFEYGERWRTHRRLFHEFFNMATVDRYDEDQRKSTSRLLKSLGDNPAEFYHHIQLATGSLALSISYGIQVESPKNPYFSATEEALDTIQAALVPGAFLVEFLPFRESSLLRLLFQYETKPSNLDSSLFSILAPRRWCPQLRRTRLQALDGQHHVTNAIRHRTTRGTFGFSLQV